MRSLQLYKDKADFPDHLQAYVTDGAITGGFDLFHHPMMVQLLPIGLPGNIVEIIDIRSKAADDALAAKAYAAHLVRYERPYRLDRLIELLDQGEFSDAEYGNRRVAATFWQLAASFWMDGEAHESDPIWTSIMHADVPHRAFMSGIKGRKAMRSLPHAITVYRGAPAPTRADAARLIRNGWSWTTERRTAERFAKRFCHLPDRPYLATAKVSRDSIAAYLLDRGESEALIEPDTVTDFVLSHIPR